MYYLSTQAVDEVLQFVKSHAAKESAIVFDYMNAKLDSPNSREPYDFWISQNEISSCITKYGFTIIEHLTHSELEKRFLSLSDGTVVEKSVPIFGMVYASV
jgi:O-methyltransferase involved in polyketide biosynthesis